MCELTVPRKVFLKLFHFYLEFWLHFAQTMPNVFLYRRQKYIIIVTNLSIDVLSSSLTLLDTQRALSIPLFLFNLFLFFRILIPCYQLSNIYLLQTAGGIDTG